jgi:hypothetical protein
MVLLLRDRKHSGSCCSEEPPDNCFAADAPALLAQVAVALDQQACFVGLLLYTLPLLLLLLVFVYLSADEPAAGQVHPCLLLLCWPAVLLAASLCECVGIAVLQHSSICSDTAAAG